MGAGASMELKAEAMKPLDCSDLEHYDTTMVKDELRSLREKLMQYVEDKSSWPLDLSDICDGDEKEDHEACVNEISYLRNALVLRTQTRRNLRRLSGVYKKKMEEDEYEEYNDSESDDDVALEPVECRRDKQFSKK